MQCARTLQEPNHRSSAIALDPLAESNSEASSSIQRRRRSLAAEHNGCKNAIHVDVPKRHSMDTARLLHLRAQQYPNVVYDDINTTNDAMFTHTAGNNNSHRPSSVVHNIVDSITGRRPSSSLQFVRLEEGSETQQVERDNVSRRSLRDSQLLNGITMPSVLTADDEDEAYRERYYPACVQQRNSCLSAFSSVRPATLASRPPSYKINDTAEQNQQRQQEWEALVHLQQLYQRERRLQSGGGWLQALVWNSGEEERNNRLRWKDAFSACLNEQFHGFHMAFWIVLLAFVGAISVFLPGISSAAFALWIPLVVYAAIAVFMVHHRRQRRRKIQRLEYQVAQAREQRIRELMAAVELPENHYFVTDYATSSRHTHPVTTLLPPPPSYH
ncbi:hypothetical protein BDB00DRAFT_832701 [Zychaea mexicana]|uniref:uncharacterized protein n=1 Tax=Zychaea mexicana TaxID=64656 RepID=UPI0022FE1C6C|nr:uncharacterized protein BDB00DRAFT_832701 [Zychaea mexicana]KAI9491543.1 hypothetical protein BDB00DRAFT_832701 [Zychaea mexicana]